MKKIPLESTIVGSYSFLFRNIISIIGTMWFPVLVMAALIGAFICQLIPHEWLQGHFPQHFDDHDVGKYILSRLPVFAGGMTGLFVAGLLVRSMVDVNLLRHATGEKTSVTLIWFSLGARVWMMLAVLFIGFVSYLILEYGAIFLILAANGVLAVIPNLPHVLIPVTNVVLGAAVVIVAVYVYLRLMFFLPAVVVAERRVSPARSWQLGKGNVFRMVVVLLAIFVPASAVFGVAVYATFISTIVVEAVRQHPEGPAKALEFLKSLLPLLPVLLVMCLILAVVLKGLMFGAMGRAYKAVIAPEETK
ncbi:MAG TPA: glycerophosphoryl diester phosphodiesterase membrane domain-containing protein [Rhizomicrobium sp.]|nr:glycerophosphoryl diester phosphodiesterase membrane domain-containing protein [Rhizomicrobium sp.]